MWIFVIVPLVLFLWGVPHLTMLGFFGGRGDPEKCPKCDYTLKDLPPNAHCPECGTTERWANEGFEASPGWSYATVIATSLIGAVLTTVLTRSLILAIVAWLLSAVSTWIVVAVRGYRFAFITKGPIIVGSIAIITFGVVTTLTTNTPRYNGVLVYAVAVVFSLIALPASTTIVVCVSEPIGRKIDARPKKSPPPHKPTIIG